LWRSRLLGRTFRAARASSIVYTLPANMFCDPSLPADPTLQQGIRVFSRCISCTLNGALVSGACHPAPGAQISAPAPIADEQRQPCPLSHPRSTASRPSKAQTTPTEATGTSLCEFVSENHTQAALGAKVLADGTCHVAPQCFPARPPLVLRKTAASPSVPRIPAP